MVAPVLRLSTQSGQAFKQVHASPAEWRARCHDFLACLTPVAALRSGLEQTMSVIASMNGEARAQGGAEQAELRSSPGLVGVHVRRDEPGVDAPDVCARVAGRVEGSVEGSGLADPGRSRTGGGSDDGWSGGGEEGSGDGGGDGSEGGGGDGEIHTDHLPLGWDQIPLSRYASLIERIAEHRPGATFLLVSNQVSTLHQVSGQPGEDIFTLKFLHSNFCYVSNCAAAAHVTFDRDPVPNYHSQLRAMLPPYVNVVAPEASPAELAAAGAEVGGFAGRQEGGVVSAAAEWLALASCDIVVGSQGSAYSLTASMRGGGLAVVLAPGSGVAIASSGEHQPPPIKLNPT